MGSIYDLREDHIKGTRTKPHGRIDFWQYDPPFPQDKPTGIKCGICKRPLEGRHCPYCLPWKQEANEAD